MPMLHTLWSTVERMSTQPAAVTDDDEDLVLGWECAVPSLHVDEWQPQATSSPEHPAGTAS
jgi:hypothetical protein